MVAFAIWCAGYWGAEGMLIGQTFGGVVFGILALVLAFRVIDQQAK
jgi:hypothetical protein